MSQGGRLSNRQAAEVLAGATAIPARDTGATIAVCAFGGTTTDGREVTIDPSSSRGATLVLFVSTGCQGCRELFGLAAEPSAAGLEASDRVVLVARESDDVATLAALAGSSLLVRSDKAFDDYGVLGAPFFSLIVPGRSRVLSEGVAFGSATVRAAVEAALAGMPGDALIRLRPGEAP